MYRFIKDKDLRKTLGKEAEVFHLQGSFPNRRLGGRVQLKRQG